MELLFHGIAWFFIVLGSIFCIIGGVGLIRFPDFYTRMHAAGVTDTLGAGCMLLGLGFEMGFSLITFKLIAILGFLWIASPTAANALASAAMARGLEPRVDRTGGGPSSRM